MASHHKWGHGTLDTHDAPLFAVGAFFFGEADFFSAKRLFLREARDVSGGEAAHREQRMGIQWRKLVFGFIPIRRLTKGLQPSHPRLPTFCSLPSIPSHLLHQKKEHSLLVLPSVNAILNFATKFFEMFTKKQSEQPHKVFQVFQVFRVFQVFHFAFGPQNSPFLVQIRTKPKSRHPPTSAV